MLDAALRFAIVNLALAIGVALVLVLRKPVRRAFGSMQAYALWLLPPLAMLASFLPPRIVERQVHFFEASAPVFEAPSVTSSQPTQDAPAVAAESAHEPAVAVTTPDPVPAEQPSPKLPAAALAFDPWMLTIAGWIVGALVMATWLASRQSRFMAAVRRGEAGPAVVGVFRPRIVMPSDFDSRFDARERGVILAHEAIHLSRHDARINAAVAFVRCLCWFNPMAHIGAHAMRIDQELACDAAVVERHPRERRLYADALLKTQLASHPLPLGCYWPANAEHPLVERIAMLKQEGPGAARRLLGVGVLVLLATGASVAAWAAQPAKEHIVQINDPAPTPQQQPRVSPQQQPAQQTPAPSPSATTPASDAYTRPMWSRTFPNRSFNLPAGFDNTDLIVLRGEVEKIEFRGASYVVFLRASSVAAGETPPANALYLRASNVAANETLPARADAHLWELPPVNYFGDSASADAIRKDMLKRRVMVAGYNAIDKSCKPTCRIFANAIDFPHRTALPPLSTTPEFGVTDFALNYDTRRVSIVHGKVQKLDFGARVFDAYVATSPHGARPSQVYQVRSEYLLPRADIEALLKGKEITVGGWLSRTAVDAPCDAACGLYGTDIQIPGVGRITPAGKKLVADASTSFPTPPRDDTAFPFVAPGLAELNALVDESEPLTLKGKLLRFEGDGLNTVIWVEVEDVQPATPGGKRGAQWRVLGGNPYIAPVGAEVTILGYNTNDKSCKPSCVMRGLSFSSANPSPATPPAPVAPPPPQPTRFEPPALPPMPSPPARPAPISADGFRTDALAVPAGYDANTQLFLKGRIEAIDFGLKSYVAKVRASSVAPTPYGLATSNTRLWRLSPVNYFGDPKAREAIRKDLIGRDVSVFGNPGGASACGADPCLFTRDLLLPRDYPGFYQPERAILRDITDDAAPVTITGKIIRSEAADPGAGREGALLIHAESVSPASIPGADRVWRVAGLAPGIGSQPGAFVSVTGFNARDTSCTPSCLMRAERATPIVPAGPAVQKIQFAPPPAPSAPGFPPGGYGFAAYFDANDPVLVKGVITKVEYITPYTQIYIEGAAGDRGGNPQRTKVQLWRGNSGQPSSISDEMRAKLVVGAEVTARGYAAKDKSCDPNCWMAIRDLIFADGARMVVGSGQRANSLVLAQQPIERGVETPPKIAQVVMHNAVLHQPGEPDLHAVQTTLDGDKIKGGLKVRSDRIQMAPDRMSAIYSGHVEVEWDSQSATADEVTVELKAPVP